MLNVVREDSLENLFRTFETQISPHIYVLLLVWFNFQVNNISVMSSIASEFIGLVYLAKSIQMT